MNLLEVKNICKTYGSGETAVKALRNVSFSVPKGEYVAILGPSGSGKTTLMNMVGCMDVMDSGEYYLDGMAIHETKEDDLTMVRNQKIGFIFQNYQLIPTYNVMQNIIMPLLMRGMTHEEAEEKCKNTIKLLGLDHRIGHKPNELSGGQKQRLCIARALLKKPKVLILDDSTSAVDTATDAKIRKAFATEIPGTTKIIIAQRISSIQDADRIIVMDNGKIDAFAPHEELLRTNEIYKEVYEAQTQTGGGDFDENGGES